MLGLITANGQEEVVDRMRRKRLQGDVMFRGIAEGVRYRGIVVRYLSVPEES